MGGHISGWRGRYKAVQGARLWSGGEEVLRLMPPLLLSLNPHYLPFLLFDRKQQVVRLPAMNCPWPLAQPIWCALLHPLCPCS